MTDLLNRLRQADVFSPLDVHFARALGRLSPSSADEVLLGAAFASRAVAHGHVCVDLRRLLERPLLDADGAPLPGARLPGVFEWVMALGQTELCSAGDRPTPLVFDGEARLYLTRYFQYQRQLAEDLGRRATESSASELDLPSLRESFSRLLPATGEQAPDLRQRLAAAIAVLRRLAVISGGPGTGKTTTVVRVLAVLVEHARACGGDIPRIALLAPTGKAAARLSESIAAGKAQLDCDEAVRAAIPDDASTIHRRLGYRPGTPTRFFHDSSNPLPADVVLVDEASMVDLALMAKLVDAVPTHARLILLGDKDQLASVEAGAILGDICNREVDPAYSPALADAVETVLGETLELPRRADDDGGIWDCVVELTRSFRFTAQGGIGRLAQAINTGNTHEVLAQLEAGDPQAPHAPLSGQVEMVPLGDETQLRAVLRRDVVEAFRPFLESRDPAERLDRLGTFRLLSAYRRGPFGTERLNAMVEELLAAAALISPSDPWYDGRPILVTHNDYQLELFNGDVGVLHRGDDGSVRAYFRDPQGELRSLSPSRLPPHESVFAMTVHKSQGSEFDRVGLLIPPQLSPILTRELIYTGVTRARTHVTLYGSSDVLVESVRRRIDRASGLRDALWGSD